MIKLIVLPLRIKCTLTQVELIPQLQVVPLLIQWVIYPMLQCKDKICNKEKA